MSPNTPDLVISPRFCGPPNSGHGGYVSGAIAGYADGPVTVTLRRPPPSDVTVQLAETLHRIDPERARKDAVPVLQTMLKPTGPWRVYAAMTLRRLKPDSEEALTTVIECVKGTDLNARQQAISFLGTLGKSARAAAPPFQAPFAMP